MWQRRFLICAVLVCFFIFSCIFGLDVFIKNDASFLFRISYHLNRFVKNVDNNKILVKILRNDSIDCFESLYETSPILRLNNNPIMLSAVEFKAWNIAEFLIKRFSNRLIDKDINGINILMPLILHEKYQLLELALSLGANPNQVDKFGLTATLDSCALGKLEALKILIRFGGDIHHKNKYQMDCRILAGLEKRNNILTYLNSAKEN